MNGKFNGKSGWIAFAAGLPLAIFLTSIFWTGVVKGQVVERVSQLERRADRQERMYEEAVKAIGKMQVVLGKISTKLGVE